MTGCPAGEPHSHRTAGRMASRQFNVYTKAGRVTADAEGADMHLVDRPVKFFFKLSNDGVGVEAV